MKGSVPQVENGLFVRAAARRAPLDDLLLSSSGDIDLVARELKSLDNSRFAESRIPLGEYLDLFDRLRFLNEGATCSSVRG